MPRQDQNKSKIHTRRTIRLKDFDYAKPAFYFITICCQDRACLFGKIVVGGQNIDPGSIHNCGPAQKAHMILNDAGKIANKYWSEIPMHYPKAILHEFIIMPNHVHGIIELTKETDVEGQNPSGVTPQQHTYQKTIPGSIGSIIRGYKIGVTKWFRQNTNIHDPWQRDFYEHVFMDELSRLRIASYILQNPEKWVKGSKF